MAKIGVVEYCNEKRINIDEYVDDLKNKISSKDHAINRLIVTINKLRDTVSHRNMQIKDLKIINAELDEDLGIQKRKVQFAIKELEEFGSIEAVKELNA